MLLIPEFLSSRVNGARVIRVDAYFLYQVGAAIRPLIGIAPTSTKAQVWAAVWAAESWLDSLINNSVFRLKTCWPSGNMLLNTIRRIRDDLSKPNIDFNSEIGFFDYHLLTTQAQAFETVLGAELQWGQLFLVEPKGGFDLYQLTGNGAVIFPSELAVKVPEAIADAKEAARCIAFALPTAAAFHLHRINELVLRRYYDAVTGGKEHPERRSINSYIDAMKNAQIRDNKIFGALAVLKNFHRNPVIHPDERLKSVDEAIALHGVVCTAITYMLSALPPPVLQLTAPPAQ